VKPLQHICPPLLRIWTRVPLGGRELYGSHLRLDSRVRRGSANIGDDLAFRTSGAGGDPCLSPPDRSVPITGRDEATARWSNKGTGIAQPCRWSTTPGSHAQLPAIDLEALTPARNRKFADSPLEEAVSSELVSEPKFPASWEYTGYFVRRGLRVDYRAWNPQLNSTTYDPIPYASEQGIYFGLAGN
jgi:hypothetical protein